jgi:hypothetical protein
MWTFLGIPVVVFIGLALLKLAVLGKGRARPAPGSGGDGRLGVGHFVGCGGRRTVRRVHLTRKAAEARLVELGVTLPSRLLSPPTAPPQLTLEV